MLTKLQAILNKSWKQHPTKQQIYGHLPPISQTIQVRRTRHAEHCWRSKDGLCREGCMVRKNSGLADNEYIYREKFIYMYIFFHPQIDCFVVSQLFSVITHKGRFKLGSKPVQLYARPDILPLSQFSDLYQLEKLTHFEFQCQKQFNFKQCSLA